MTPRDSLRFSARLVLGVLASCSSNGASPGDAGTDRSMVVNEGGAPKDSAADRHRGADAAADARGDATRDAGLDANVGTTVGDFYVATNGKDTWSGTLAAPNAGATDGPFLTFDRARLAVQPFKSAHPGKNVTVVFRGGTYLLPATLMFGASDSGAANQQISYTNYTGETPVVSGGIAISGWSQPSAGRWTVSLPASALAFEQLFVGGTRRFRPRTTPTSYLDNVGPVIVATSAIAQTTCPSANAQLADGTYECFDRFVYANSDMSAAWTNLGGAYPAGDIEVLDFENFTMPRLRLASVDTADHIAILTGPTVLNANGHGFIAGHRYLAENVKDALSQAGQWFLDRSTSPWTLTYLAEAGESPTTTEVIAPQLEQLLVAQSLAYVTFSGLTFSHSNWIPPAAGWTSAQAEPGISAALSFQESTRITLDGCVVSHTGGYGLEIEGASAAPVPMPNNQILNGELTDLGAGGIRIGTTTHGGDTDATVPQGNVVQNNIVTATGRLQPAGGGVAIWVGDSHHNTVTHNEVYDSYGGGIGMNVPLGGMQQATHDNVVSYNHVYTINQGVMRDGGAIYVAALNQTGNKVLNNRVHDVWADPSQGSYGGWGIYLDNGTSNVLVQNNLVYRVGAATFFNHDGTGNTYDNNIFAFGREAMAQDGAYFTKPAVPTFTATHNIFYFDMGRLQAKNPWYCFGAPCVGAFDFDKNLYWSTTGPVMFYTSAKDDGGMETAYTFAQWKSEVLEDVDSATPADPMFTDASYMTDNYTLLDGSPALAAGFTPFDLSAPGRTSTTLMPPAAPPGFPLQLPADPATAY
jgi:hypothetical protein